MLVQRLEQLLNEIRQRRNKYEFIKIQSAKESTMYGKMKKASPKKKSGGLTAKQKTLPKQLQQKIMKAKKKK